jgi:hypothetical protein
MIGRETEGINMPNYSGLNIDGFVEQMGEIAVDFNNGLISKEECLSRIDTFVKSASEEFKNDINLCEEFESEAADFKASL